MKNDLLLMLQIMKTAYDGPPINVKCYSCKHKKEVAGNAHIACAKPCIKVTGHSHGIENGWFMYPMLFDPTWMTTPCSTFESAETVSLAVSDPVSQETV